MYIEEIHVQFETGTQVAGHGTAELMAFYPGWALPKVKQIPTFTTRWNMETR